MIFRKLLRLLGALLILSLLLGCATAGRKKADPGPAEVLDQFIAHVFAGAGEPAYNLLAVRAQAEIPKDDFIKLVSLFDPERFLDVVKEFAGEEIGALSSEKELEVLKVVWQLIIAAIHLQAGEETINGDEATVELIIEYPDPDKLTEFEQNALIEEGMAIFTEVMLKGDYDLADIRKRLEKMLSQVPRTIETVKVHMVRETGGWRLDFDENLETLQRMFV